MENRASRVINTNNALKKLENILKCRSCYQHMKIPVTLWSCDHVFCKLCIRNHTTCPTCHMPAWAQDQTENRRLESISSLCCQLRQHMDNFVGAEKKQEKSSSLSNLAQKRKIPQNLQEKPSNDKDAISLCKNKSCHSPNNLPNHSKVVKNVCVLQNEKRAKLSTPFSSRTRGNTCSPSAQSKSISSSIKMECNLTPKSTGKNVKGESPLHLAAISGDTKQVEVLLKQNVNDVNAKDNAGWTPLHEACNRGYISIVESLLDAGAFIDIPGYENETPLIDAVENGRVGVVKVLLLRGANAELRNSNGKTAIELAKTTEMKKLFQLHISRSSIDTKQIEQFSHSQPSNIMIAHSNAVHTNKVKSLCSLLRARSVSDNANGSTHFIVPFNESLKMKRTLKYLQAMATGSWIVYETWMDKCLECKKWVSELDFLVNGSFEDDIAGGPLRSVTAKLKLFPRLFNNCHFFLYGNFSYPSPNKQQLTELLKISDGQILRREPKPDSDIVQTCRKVPYHSKANTPQYYYTYYIVYDPSQPVLPRLVRQGKVCTVPASWILDCISQFHICDID